MKRTKLIAIIQECLAEVIIEDNSALDAAKKKEQTEKEQWLQAKKAETDAELNNLRNSKTLSETDLEEMARIPTLYNLAPGINPEEYTGVIKQIAQYLQQNPGKTKMEIAKGIGKNAQQAVNMIVKAMEEKGIVDSQGLQSEPKYKKSDGLGTGLRGRKLSPEGAKRRAIQSVYDKLMNGKEDEITFEEDELIGDDGMQKIRALVAQGGIKRGRPKTDPNTIETPEEEEEETIDSDEDMYTQGGEDEDFGYLKGDEDKNDEFETEPEEFEEIPDEENNDELTQLTNQKDELVKQFKSGKFGDPSSSEAVAKYRELIGDIPKRIKQLQSGEEEVVDMNDPNDFITEKMMRIANIR